MMNQLTLPVLAAALVVLDGTGRVQGATGDSANAPDFIVFCSLVHLAETEVETAVQTPAIPEEALNDLREIWVAIADPNDTGSLPSKLGATGAPTADAACKGTTAETSCKANWTKWQAAKQRIGQAQDSAKHKPLNEKLRTSPWGKLAAAQMAEIEAAANRRLEEYNSGLKSNVQTTKKNLQSLLSDALYGDGQTSFDGTEQRTRTLGRDRNDGCGTGNTGKSLVGDILCLCVVDNQQRNSKSCGFETATCSAGEWTACTGDNAKQAWEQIKNECAHFKKLDFSEASILHALAAFSGRLKTDAKADPANDAAIYIGQSHTQKCGTPNQKERCVDYTSAFKQGKTRAAISWYDKLATAANTLTTLKNQSKEVQAKQYAINQLTQEADRIYLALSTLTINDIEAHPQRPPALAGGLSNQKEKCSQYKNNKTACTEANCKWEENASDKSKGTCKPKEGEGQTNQGAGEGAATNNTETKKCSDKKKDDCKSPDCNWDGKECKDSSILVNKHFALSVVSAAFVALLF